MRAATKTKGGKLTYLDKKVEVPAPEGYHWMVESGRYYLMQGDYKPHANAVEKAEFKLVQHGKKE